MQSGSGNLRKGELIQRSDCLQCTSTSTPRPLMSSGMGSLKSIEDLDNHRIVTFGENLPSYLAGLNWLETAGRVTQPASHTRVFSVNNLMAIAQGRGSRHRHRCIAGLHRRGSPRPGPVDTKCRGSKLRNLLSSMLKPCAPSARLKVFQGFSGIKVPPVAILTM